MVRFGPDAALPEVLMALATHGSAEGSSLGRVARAVHGPDVENRRRPMMADDPNGRMKAARDAMNKTVVSQFEIRSS
jgi:hypothetical protein